MSECCCVGEKKLINQNYIGPGMWFVIHSEAKHAITIKDQLKYCKFIGRLQESFPCPKCKKHFGEYLDKNSPYTYVSDHENSMFTWAYDFHSSVNRRIGKEDLSWDEVWKLYFPSPRKTHTT